MFGAGAHYTHIYILYTETEKDRHIDRQIDIHYISVYVMYIYKNYR